MRWLVPVLVAAACGPSHVTAGAPPAPAVVEPAPEVLRRVRLDAARTLRCSAAAVRVEPRPGAPRIYDARGCGWRVAYLVACDTPEVCEHVVAEDPSLGP